MGGHHVPTVEVVVRGLRSYVSRAVASGRVGLRRRSPEALEGHEAVVTSSPLGLGVDGPTLVTHVGPGVDGLDLHRSLVWVRLPMGLHRSPMWVRVPMGLHRSPMWNRVSMDLHRSPMWIVVSVWTI